jgi:LPXTG-site transpeptidase (sortase) family protein
VTDALIAEPPLADELVDDEPVEATQPRAAPQRWGLRAARQAARCLTAATLLVLSAVGVAVAGWPPAPRAEAVGTVSIARLGIQVPIVEGSSARSTVRALGHLRRSAQPGSPGNVVLVGRHATFGRVLAHLDRLRAGDAIDLRDGTGIARYVVRGPATNHADIGPFADTADQRLTLITAARGAQPRGWSVVVADLVTAPRAEAPHAADTPVPVGELGLDGSGDPGAVARAAIALATLAPLVAWLLFFHSPRRRSGLTLWPWLRRAAGVGTLVAGGALLAALAVPLLPAAV